MTNLFEILKADKRLFVFAVVAVIVIVLGAVYIFYNSQARVIERLIKENPRGEEFARTIAEQTAKLNEAGLSAKERTDILLARAVAREALGDKKGAIEDYQAVIELNAAHPIARNNLAGLYIALGDYEKAEYQYLAIIATQPQIFDGYVRLVDLYEGYLKNKEDFIPAVLLFAIDRNGRQPIFLERLAQYYFDRGLYVQAVERIDELLEIDPNNEFGKFLLEEMKKKS